MPYKSEKQRKFMNAAAARGEVPQKVADEFNAASKGKKLPESAPKKKAKKRKVKSIADLRRIHKEMQSK